MSAGRSIVAAGIVGVVLWALKREAEYHKAQDGGSINTAPMHAATRRLDGSFFDSLSDLLKGIGRGDGATKSGSDILSSLKKEAEPVLASYAPQTAISRPTTGGTGVARLLTLIRTKEAPRGYDDYFRGVSRPPPRPLTTMTVGEVLDWQDSIDRTSPSEAAGGYQIMEDTLRGLVGQGHAKKTEKFSPAVQDRLAIALLNRRGLKSYQAGRLSETDFANNIAMEWASFPVVSAIKGHKKFMLKPGQSYYSGDGLNKAYVPVSDVLAAVRAI